MASPALDGSNFGGGAFTGSSCALSVSTGGTNRFITFIVLAGRTTNSSFTSTSLVSTAPVLTATKRATATNTATGFALAEVWYVAAPAQLTNVIFTWQLSGSVDNLTMYYAAWTGVAATPWDPRVGNPSLTQNTSGGTTNPFSPVTTTNPDDVTFAFLARYATTQGTFTAQGGTAVGAFISSPGGTNWNQCGIIYNVVSAPQSAVNIGITQNQVSWNLFTDAITANAAAATSTSNFFFAA